MSSKGYARRVTCRIFYDGQDIGLPRFAESISYTDNSEGMSDEVTINITGALSKRFFRQPELEKEHELDVTLVFKNWWSNGTIRYYKCGKFTIDDLTYSGPAHQLAIKGLALPASTEFKETKRSNTWENTTLSQIVFEKCQYYGLKFYYNSPAITIESIEQDNETDSNFLLKTCEKYGQYIKILATGIAVFDKAILEEYPPVKTYRESDMENFTWNSTLVNTYTGVTISYTNPNADKNTGKDQTITLTLGTGPRILTLNETCENEAEARVKACAAINAANEKAQTIEFTTLSNWDPFLKSTQVILIANMGRATGKYFVTSVSHSVSDRGHQMRVTAYKLFKRFP